jgi:hypothetical protein
MVQPLVVAGISVQSPASAGVAALRLSARTILGRPRGLVALDCEAAVVLVGVGLRLAVECR